MVSDAEKLKALMNSAKAILQEPTFEKAARIIFDQCCAVTGAKSGYVALLSADGSENEVLFLEAGGMPCTVDPSLPMPIRGLREESYRTGKAVYHNDFMHSKWVSFMPAGHMDMKNVMFSPLNIEGKTVGIMGLANKERDFTDEDAQIAMVLGDMAAIGLKNSRQLDLLHERNTKLEAALGHVKRLQGLIPICSHCKRVRDDSGYWSAVEQYVSDHSEASFSHSLCPECLTELYPQEAKGILEEIGGKE